MFRPFSVFIGYRYARAKRKNHFISFISLTSMLGIAIGVTALITVLSVMNGFSKEIRKQMLGVVPHIMLRSVHESLYFTKELVETIKSNQEVKAIMPLVESQCMVLSEGELHPVFLLGVEPKLVESVYNLSGKFLQGDLESLTQNKYSIAIGHELARKLGVTVGNKITLVTAAANTTPLGIIPQLKRFTVSAVFETGTNYDAVYAFTYIKDAAILARLNDEITGIQISLHDELQAREVGNNINRKLQYKYWVVDWTQKYGDFFEAIKMEKTVMWLILLLIVIVAAFNLVSSLVMMVADKRPDIAILRVLGASRKEIMAIFMAQGSYVGIIGTLLGLIFGLLLAYNVTDLVELIQNLLHVKFISEDVYMIGFVPSKIEARDVFSVTFSSILISFLVTLYPAWRATKIQPAEALRYE